VFDHLIPKTMRGLSPSRAIFCLAPPAGLILGAVAWAVFGGSSAAAAKLHADQTHLASVRISRTYASPDSDLAMTASAHPLFALTTGPGAIADVIVQLDGVSKSSSRAAALIAINGAAADWLDLGKSRDGVTLVAVQASQVELETPLGRKEVAMGDAAPTSPSSGAPAASSATPSQSAARSPSPPANTPRS
jgi:hypothetical protein